MLQIYKSLESGPLQELTLKTLEKGAWINIVDPTPYELKVVSNLTEVDPDFLRSALMMRSAPIRTSRRTRSWS